MNRYPIPGHRKMLRTSSKRRYLIVSAYDGTARVETTTDDQAAAQALVTRYRQEFPGPTKIYLFDQTAQIAGH
jgi:hypothetical protein